LAEEAGVIHPESALVVVGNDHWLEDLEPLAATVTAVEDRRPNNNRSTST
jgi:hypothetical protein